MPTLYNKTLKREEFVPNELVQEAAASGEYDIPEGLKIALTTPAGRTVEGTPADVAASQGALDTQTATEGQIGQAEQGAYLQQEHGGVGGTLATFGEQASDTATFGGFGAVTNALLGPDYTEERAGRLEVHPTAGTLGTVAGAVAPALLSGGEGGPAALAKATPAGAAARLAETVASTGRGGGLAAKVAAGVAGYALEGSFYGAGHVLSESILQDKELSAEAFLAGAGQGALWGGAGGGAAELLSAGVQGAKRIVDNVTEGRGQLAVLRAEQKAAVKAADRAEREASRIRIEQERSANRSGLEELKQKGRLDVVEAKGKAASGLAETRLKVVDKQTSAALAKAEAAAVAARSRVNKSSEALAVEHARLERAKLVMDGRLQLADTYTAGWRRAADSRETVAASKLEAADIGANAKMRTGFADALVRSGREDAGHLIEELIPAKLRTPEAVESARGDVLNMAQQHAAKTEDLVRLADDVIATNPMVTPELRAARDRAAEASPKLREWVDGETGAAEQAMAAASPAITHRGEVTSESFEIGGLQFNMEGTARGAADDVSSPRTWIPSRDEGLVDRYYVRITMPVDKAPRGLPLPPTADSPLVVGNAQFIVRDGELYPMKVSVVPELQRNGLASRMYKTAEDMTGKKVVPAAKGGQTDQGREFSSAYRSRRDAATGGRQVGTPPPLHTATDFGSGLETMQTAEQAHHDLAQALRPHLDEVSGGALDESMAGMDEAINKQDEIMTGAVAQQAEAKAAGAPPAAGAHARRSGLGDTLGVLDLAAAVGGLPNAHDVPVIGPLLSVYLKYRALRGALGKLGIRIGGPVANIARTGASVQDRATQALSLLVKGAEKGVAVAKPVAAPLMSVLSQPLWQPLKGDEASPPKPNDRRPGPEKLFEQRQEEILRATEDPAATKQAITAAIPAPPAMASAIADAFMTRMSFLAGYLPKDPRPLTVKPTPYRPSAGELQRFGEAVAAVRDPIAVLRNAAVSVVSPTAAAALREAYPRLFAQIQQQLLEQVASNDVPLPYERKHNLSTVFDVPLDASLLPDYRAARQAEWQAQAQAAPPAPGPSSSTLTLSKNEETGALRRSLR